MTFLWDMLRGWNYFQDRACCLMLGMILAISAPFVWCLLMIFVGYLSTR